MIISALYTYPVKSMGSVALQEAEVEARGLRGDRRWLVTDPDGRFVTGRQLGALAACQARFDGDRLHVSYGDAALSVAVPALSSTSTVVVWQDHVPAADAGDEAADWLSSQFGRPLRLKYQAESHRREIPERRRANAGDHVSFADAYPLLAIGSGSLDELNGRLDAPVAMANFRPNVVFESDTAFVEDGWRDVLLGDVRCRVMSPCSRCVFTTVEPSTGRRRDDGEPLATLSGYRRDPDSKKILFGVNVIPLEAGRLCVGDTVRPLDD